jgi:hypothetical protein
LGAGHRCIKQASQTAIQYNLHSPSALLFFSPPNLAYVGLRYRRIVNTVLVRRMPTPWTTSLKSRPHHLKLDQAWSPIHHSSHYTRSSPEDMMSSSRPLVSPQGRTGDKRAAHPSTSCVEDNAIRAIRIATASESFSDG